LLRSLYVKELLINKPEAAEFSISLSILKLRLSKADLGCKANMFPVNQIYASLPCASIDLLYHVYNTNGKRI